MDGDGKIELNLNWNEKKCAGLGLARPRDRGLAPFWLRLILNIAFELLAASDHDRAARPQEYRTALTMNICMED